MDYKDYYKILGVDKNVTKEEIKKQYRKLARKYHPDVNPRDKDAAHRFAEINEANEVLMDDDKRKKYDTLGSDWQRYQSTGHAGDFDWSKYAYAGGGDSRGRTFSEGDLNEMFGGLGGFSDFFRSIFGQGSQTYGGQRATFAFKGQDLYAELAIPLEEAYSGSVKVININNKNLRITLNPGIRDGQTIRLKGKGQPGINGGANGDLYITFLVQLHPDYKRISDDLHMEISVSIYTALLGGSLSVQTLSGKFKLNLPPETKNGTVFRLKGRGFPVYGNKRAHGDLYVKVNLRLPESLTSREKELVKELASLRNET
jgi:curved DNA-binding protein